MLSGKERTYVEHRLEKAPTGIRGFDEITQGGLPKGRTALVTGGPGTGKTMFAMEFLVKGATEFGEPGVFVSFEETADELIANSASLGLSLPELCDANLLYMDYVRVERSEIEESGEYDLEGLFIRLSHAINTVGARRLVLDTIETLFSGLSNVSILRAELRRLFRWLKDKNISTIVTGERGAESLTREGLEEYVSDCVILLDHRVTDQVSTRRLRVLKYRGSEHGTNEYPFLISDRGFMVLPITSVKLDYAVGEERVSSGIPRLDAMLGGKGFYRGSLILVSGTAGTGKTTVAASFADAACRRGEKTMYFAFEESAQQVVRNMRSIGLDLEQWTGKGILKIVGQRPTIHGLEHHLMSMQFMIDDFRPTTVVVDPVTNLSQVGSLRDVRLMLSRLVDYLKARNITILFTSLTQGGTDAELTDVGISSLADSWMKLQNLEAGGERNRGISILKSRGMSHSNQVREFLLTDQGIDLVDTYTGPEGVLAGSARVAREDDERAQEAALRLEIERLEEDRKKRRALLEDQITRLRSEYESAEKELEGRIRLEKLKMETIFRKRKEMGTSRKAET
ncbi:MAG TPA: circadian clock protein KaiC [Deltaproteobacteria bacterium]|jgi:circadian clock protein KaiC|nr:circadian clock protein KaiC [Bacteriovoracaceae bacterium]HOD69679.1 circadian clock protein KaiC [Deltaproteobacteria bacterium]HPA83449.1 circadian clock protein KaiC [Deltaproteobacteria bacterium]HQO80276.1 circadian clock protein KaiC [Deltaproteobacteria bacterium]HQQ15463.1 circadian clock protein KaiC [Deltaproteobacteria bacterium]